MIGESTPNSGLPPRGGSFPPPSTTSEGRPFVGVSNPDSGLPPHGGSLPQDSPEDYNFYLPPPVDEVVAATGNLTRVTLMLLKLVSTFVVLVVASVGLVGARLASLSSSISPPSLLQLRHIASKVSTLAFSMVQAVTPLFNTWHPLRSFQNVRCPASFDRCTILLPSAHCLSPLKAPPMLSSLSNLHWGLLWIMGGSSLTRGVEEVYHWGLENGGLCLGWLTVWWTYFRWYSTFTFDSWGAMCPG